MSILREEKVRFLLQLGGITVIALLAWWLWKTRGELRAFTRLESEKELTIECVVSGPVKKPGIYACRLSTELSLLTYRAGGLENGYRWNVNPSNRIELWVARGTTNLLSINDLVFKPNRWDYAKDTEGSVRRTLRYR
jgi:hypothetical protein